MITSLVERRSALEQEIAGLEAAAGVALLDEAMFDVSTLLTRHADLVVIDAALSEERRRERMALEGEEQARLGAIAVKIMHTLPKHRDAVERAELACKALVEALADASSTATDLRDQCAAYGGRSPVSIDPVDMPKALSGLIAQELRRLGRPCNYGYLRWPSGIDRKWSDHFDKAVRPAFDLMLGSLPQSQEGNDNGRDQD